MPCWKKVGPEPPKPGDPGYKEFEDECPDSKKKSRKDEKELVPA